MTENPLTEGQDKDLNELIPFICDQPGCSRKFKRSDHLLRHKRNHLEKLFDCSWPGCSKSFVRKDVRLKHFKRHFAREEKVRQRKERSIKFFELYTPASSAAIRIPMNETSYERSTSISRNEYMDTQKENKVMDLIDNNIAELMAQPIALEFQTPSSPIQKFENNEIKDVELENLIEIFLNDNENSSKYFEYSPSSLKDLLDGTPDFIYSTSQSILSEETKLKMIQLIPSLSGNELFLSELIEKYLDSFWSSYHIQFPIIHRPSFSTSKANPLLLLSMITIGASSLSKNSRDKLQAKLFLKLAEQIAQPLRWLICSETEVFPTVTSWIIQSLLILECFEITCSNRRFHRRANLHHGLKIELLRRSPLLGGDPLKLFEDDKELGPWENWIELESLKRCAYVAFLVDTYNATIFGHDTIIYPHHIQLSLPCSEELWENNFQDDYSHTSLNDSNTNSSSSSTGNEKFLLLIAKILRKNKISSSALTNHLLLGGLISLSLQMEQKDMPSKILQFNVSRSNWKNDLLASLDFWYDNVINGSCCKSNKSFHQPRGIPEILNDSSCKFSIYHISQAFLRLSQYDCIIYAGAPTRMNVKADDKDVEIVKERISKWANSVNGKISVTHAYILICETLLGENDFGNETIINYDPNQDTLFYRPNIIASALFLIWAYNFCLYGPESNHYNQLPKENQTNFYKIVSTCFHEKLNGYTYIKRVKKCFTLASKDSRGSKLFWQYSGNLDQIPNKNYTVGLLRLFSDKYLKCNSQVCIEYGKLMENCIQRSLGRVSVICEDMFESLEL